MIRLSHLIPLVLLVGLVVAAPPRARAAQYQFFFTVPGNALAGDPVTTLRYGRVPRVEYQPADPFRVYDVVLWMALDARVIPVGEGSAGFGFDIGQTGGQRFASDLVVYNPNGRWPLGAITESR